LRGRNKKEKEVNILSDRTMARRKTNARRPKQKAKKGRRVVNRKTNIRAAMQSKAAGGKGSY